MPKARKQKNGKWRCQLYLGDKVENGKRKQIVKSFTANTRQEAEMLAYEYQRVHARVPVENITVGECIDRYISARDKTLSPSTIRAYRSYKNGVLSSLCGTTLHNLDTETFQGWINANASTCAAKTLKNAASLALSAIRTVDPSYSVNLSFPARIRKRTHVPTQAEVDALCAATTNENTRKAILLAAYCSLRRSEACALTMDDIDFAHAVIHVGKARVETEDGTFITKPYTKTEDSFRDVPAPQIVLDAMRTGPITCTPNAITRSFEKTVKRAGLPHIRYHDLRHFYASYFHAKGIPDAYIEQFGGWRPGSGVMKQVYREALEDERKRQAEKIIQIVSANVSATAEKA